jgi:hypothetical protein
MKAAGALPPELRASFNHLPIPILSTAYHDLDIWHTVG